jgi:hypothetical protein
VGKRAQPHPASENNSFLEGFSEWMDSPEGEVSREVSDEVWALMDSVGVDARNREIIWDDGTALDIEGCIQRIHRLFPDLPLQLIETHVLSWLEFGFVPQGWSQDRLQQLDGLIERWLSDYHRQRRRRKR